MTNSQDSVECSVERSDAEKGFIEFVRQAYSDLDAENVIKYGTENKRIRDDKHAYLAGRKAGIEWERKRRREEDDLADRLGEDN